MLGWEIEHITAQSNTTNITGAPSLELLSEISGTLFLISSVSFWFKMMDEAHATAFPCHPQSLKVIENIVFTFITEL